MSPVSPDTSTPVLSKPRNHQMNPARDLRLCIVLILFTFGMNTIARGVSETFAVFLLHVQTDLGVTRSQMTGVYSSFMLVLAVTSLIAGLLLERLRARTLYTFGTLMLCGGYYLAGGVTQIWQYWLCSESWVGWDCRYSGSSKPWETTMHRLDSARQDYTLVRL